MRRFSRKFVRKLRSLDSFRRKLKRPGKNQRDRETEDNQQHYRARNRIGEMQRRNHGCGDLHHEPSNDRVSDGNFVDIAPFQLSEEVLRIHSARLDEALVTAALYLDTRDLKSDATSNATGEESLSLITGQRSWPADAGSFRLSFRSTSVKGMLCSRSS